MKEDCYDQFDSVKVSIDYLEFTQEFTRGDSLKMQPYYFPIRKNRNLSASQYLKLRVLNDSINLNDSAAKLVLYVEKPDINIFTISFKLDFGSLKDYISADSGFVINAETEKNDIESTTVSESDYIASITVSNNPSFLRGDKIIVNLKHKDIIHADYGKCRIKVFPGEISECNCLGAYFPDSVKVAVVPNEVSVKEIENLNEYTFDGQNLTFSEDFDKVRIYDIRGCLIADKNAVTAGEDIQINSFYGSALFAVLEKNTTTKRILIIKH